MSKKDNKAAAAFELETLEEAATILAQQKAMERSFRMLSHGSRLFTVEEGWESDSLVRDATVRKCDTLLELDDAMKNPQIKKIFMSKSALITEQDVDKVCRRNGATKTLFKEVGR